MRAQLRKMVLIAMVCIAANLPYMTLDGAAAHHDPNHDATGDVIPVRQLLDIYECSRCHRLNTPHRLIGPSLWQLGKRKTAAAVRASLLDPNAIIVPGFPAGLMQKRLQEVGFYSDIARRPAVLDRIVAYLIGPRDMASSTDTDSDTTRVQPPAPSSGSTIDTAAVTKQQFAAFIADGGYTTKRYWDRIGWASVIRRRHRSQPSGWDPGRDTSSSEPLVGVNWYEADAYCRWLGKTLPSVQEWERACVDMPMWSDAPPQSALQWEWTADAIWKAALAGADHSRDHCTERVVSHRALDGHRTGFRCRAITR
ncbi:SUMF1/EgtB/PvdO family nonheme iron enzyme [Candidatus Entotheonella palauensis]|nr:SUMF1/EgtB/PvdO family nonheme iron enzyme [Candidatus Entotheonella palauensis]